MDIRIPNLSIEPSKGFEVVVVHSRAEWQLDDSVPMEEEGDEWLLRDAEKYLEPDEPFKIVVVGFEDYGEAERAYFARGAAGMLAEPRKLFWDPEQKLFYLLVPGFVTFETPGRKWNNRFTPLAG